MNDRGVLGLPVRLAVAFIIIALFTPSLVSAVERYTETSQVSEARSQADVIVDTAGDVWYSGEGSSETVSVSVPSGYEVVIGGTGGDAWSYSVQKGDAVKERSYTDSPKIRFIGDPLVITGRCDVTVTATTDTNGNYGIAVTSA